MSLNSLVTIMIRLMFSASRCQRSVA